ncbi:hypothetical protein M8818_002362 [Zalaria obscura]|uniref:Uncharacterized protein n=1 Tax=Zalaria obscura TaxID=2024903 RepID=A0ACC3SHK3_9PEZI
MEEPAGAGDDGFANGAEKGAHVSPGLGKESGPDGVWSCWRRDTGGEWKDTDEDLPIIQILSPGFSFPT